jgi:hypothetical protein
MIRWTARIILFAVITGAGYYLLPENLKDNVQKYMPTSVFNIGSNPIKEKIDKIVQSPEKKRETLLSSLKSSLSGIKESLGEESAGPRVNDGWAYRELERAEEIISELVDLNDDSGAVNQLTAETLKKLTDVAFQKFGSTTPLYECPAPEL